jgi:DNA-binding CsgD family transcriptional regulator
MTDRLDRRTRRRRIDLTDAVAAYMAGESLLRIAMTHNLGIHGLLRALPDLVGGMALSRRAELAVIRARAGDDIGHIARALRLSIFTAYAYLLGSCDAHEPRDRRAKRLIAGGLTPLAAADAAGVGEVPRWVRERSVSPRYAHHSAREIAARWRAGESARTIADSFGCSPSVITAQARRARLRGEPMPRQASGRTPAIRAALLAGEPLGAIASRFGVSHQYLSRLRAQLKRAATHHEEVPSDPSLS